MTPITVGLLTGNPTFSNQYPRKNIFYAY